MRVQLQTRKFVENYYDTTFVYIVTYVFAFALTISFMFVAQTQELVCVRAYKKRPIKLNKWNSFCRNSSK